jgi:hypothetical protein
MASQQEITDFLNHTVEWPRVENDTFGWSYSPRWDSFASMMPKERPTAAQLADHWLGVAEFRSLQLGTWLGTTEGQMIAQAVEAMSPPLYRQDEELLVAGLTLAAQRQQEEGQQRAGKYALGLIGVAGLVALGIGGSAAGRAA